MPYTPGPWEVNRLRSNPNEVYIVGANHRSVAYVIHNDDDRKEQAPDAALIAAAPELLAACEAALAFVQAAYGNMQTTDPLACELRRVIGKADRIP